MRIDLDRLMGERGLDWLLVLGEPARSPEVHYLVRGAGVGFSYILVRRGNEPFLIVGPMEREEAKAAGLPLATLNEYGAGDIARQAPNPLEYERRLLNHILVAHEVRGRVAVYGQRPVQRAYPLLRLVAEDRRLDLGLVDEPDLDIFQIARLTKAPEEVARIREVGRKTCEIVRTVVDFLGDGRVEGGVLRRRDGSPVKVGDVKALVTLECARRRLEEGGETIFAPARDAAFPHSRGRDEDPIPAGRAIIFDIFPREKNGGYHFDMTRTFCLGPMPERVRAIYELVREAQARAVAAIAPGVPTRDVDELVCDLFEAAGHPTLRKDSKTTSGYCHSLGHGVGLELHERPKVSQLPTNKDVFQPGMIVTVEPGLYYPDEGIGARVEDTVHVCEDGAVEDLTPYPKDPAIAVEGT